MRHNYLKKAINCVLSAADRTLSMRTETTGSVNMEVFGELDKSDFSDFVGR